MEIGKSEKIVRTQESFYRDFDFIFTHESLEGVRSAFRERKYQISAAKVTSRVINHWEAKGLLPEGFLQKPGWRKFMVLEIAWIKIVNRLRYFGVSLQKIAQIKNHIMGWDKETETYPLFEYYLMRAIASIEDPYVVLWADGTADIAFAQEIEITKIEGRSQDMLLISLKSIAKELGVKKVLAPDFMLAVSNNEVRVIDKIRGDGVNEVNIKLKEKDAGLIETTRVEYDPDSIEKFHREMKDNKEYGEITTRYLSGQRKVAEIKKKTKLT